MANVGQGVESEGGVPDGPLDKYGLSLFVQELVIQGEMAGVSEQEFASIVNRSILTSSEPSDRDKVSLQLHLQSILTCAVKMRNVLWPTYVPRRGTPSTTAAVEKAFTLARGVQIRAALDVATQYDILQNADVRHAYEHYDDRLDRLLEAGYGIFLDRNFGPLDDAWRWAEQTSPLPIAPDAKREILRHVDIAARRIYFSTSTWIDLQDLMPTMKSLYERAVQWMLASRAYQPPSQPGDSFFKFRG